MNKTIDLSEYKNIEKSQLNALNNIFVDSFNIGAKYILIKSKSKDSQIVMINDKKQIIYDSYILERDAIKICENICTVLSGMSKSSYRPKKRNKDGYYLNMLSGAIFGDQTNKISIIFYLDVTPNDNGFDMCIKIIKKKKGHFKDDMLKHTEREDDLENMRNSMRDLLSI